MKGVFNMKTFNLTWTKDSYNGTCYALIIKAEDEATARAYYMEQKPDTRIIGISEGCDMKPGNPIMTVPEGWEPKPTEEEPAEIDPAELLEDLDTGDHGGRLNDYRDSSSYIRDAISEIADSDTSIYYYDILNFIRENPEALADVVAEGLYEVRPGTGYDLYKHGQAAEYLTIERDIYAHMRDAVLLCAVDFIRYDLKRETIPADLADLLKEWADEADNNDRMDEIPDKIREYFETAEESED
jgi:hypothetical protein